MSKATFAAEALACVRGERLVFSDLDFQVSSGEALILRGPNGSGKSTLLRLVAGYLDASAGILTWNGQPVADDPDAHRRRLHYVGHLDAVKAPLTVAENLAFWAGQGHRDESGGDLEDRLRQALERLGLGRLAEVPGRFLSAGQKRRLNLARLAASPARLWLLDEPTVSLDANGAGVLAEMVVEHLGAGGLAMIATHIDLGLIETRVLTLGATA
ncbi:MAG TPA: heme ABC exporter ATP-binding protein CcmA [Alphaproteobacteria bacterium]|nr:heme ABC exporter ATP-binding protein CcmA [Alphaproteobacteria bacterium]MDP6269173.1 heme ABC exporter ATP-binding protein CcmA [Alphaproteobacteria bacterium]MDP7164778.1 heme ABC exporter ATP-binding protein CcmA [Alphaproteobacteria bacterium]MDP7428267.1 heme ABC exporter ATP-binding protein CcmA [Alphaproteobacteria bacterium]HJM50998.1 heme ABC exporter ATP-binding protein CcmA [Alphaproteobacteria bacterium]